MGAPKLCICVFDPLSLSVCENGLVEDSKPHFDV